MYNMGITIDNEVENFKGSPGIITDLFANRPATAATGTIFIASNTGAIYSFNGIAWVTLGGGGGPTPGIKDVLNVNQPLTGAATYQILMQSGSRLQTFDNGLANTVIGIDIQGGLGRTFIGASRTNGTHIYVGAEYSGSGGFPGNTIYTQINGGQKIGYYIAASKAQFGRYTVGSEFCFDFTPLQIGINYNGTPDYFVINPGISGNISLGGYNSLNPYLLIDFASKLIQTNFVGSGEGIILDYGSLANEALCYFGSQNIGTFPINLYLETGTGLFRLQQSSNPVGISIDLASDTYLFGNPLNNYFEITGSYLRSYFGVSNDGLNFDYTSGTPNQIFQYGGFTFAAPIFLQVRQNFIQTYYGGNVEGLDFDFSGAVFTFGSSPATCKLEVNAAGGFIMWNSTDYPRFDDNGSGNMISATAGGSSGNHLNIKINGADYKIALLNP